MELALLIVFACGVATFAAHRAVLESRHPLMAQLRQHYPWLRPWVSLAAEFVVLVLAMVLVVELDPLWAGLYLLYTLGCWWTATGLLGWRP